MTRAFPSVRLIRRAARHDEAYGLRFSNLSLRGRLVQEAKFLDGDTSSHQLFSIIHDGTRRAADEKQVGFPRRLHSAVVDTRRDGQASFIRV